MMFFSKCLHVFFAFLLCAVAVMSPFSLRADQVIISELMYHPAAGDPEYIELENLTANPIDMASWEVEGVGYTFPAYSDAQPTNSFFRPFERVLLTSVDESTFRAAYPQTPGAVRIFSGYTGKLSNGGERLSLKDKNGLEMSSLTYDDRGDWPLAADGGGYSLVIRRPNGDPRAAENWRFSAQRGGTPGAGPDVEPLVRGRIRLSEIAFDGSNRVAWVEVYNGSTNAIVGSNVVIGTVGDFSLGIPLQGTISAGDYGSVDVPSSIAAAIDDRIFLGALDGNRMDVLDVALTEKHPARSFLQRFPAGAGCWYSASMGTRDLANDPDRETAIVINEIMTEPLNGSDYGEFVELFNRGAQTVDLTSWSFDEGIDFGFSPGTLLAAGAYLVVARDRDWFHATYPGVNCVGNFGGRLSNGGERIRLVDAEGNQADDVRYRFQGDWPYLARGLGSSLELVHPSMDNTCSSAWRSSDEGQKGSFKSYSVVRRYQNLKTLGSATDYFELHFSLVGDGYIEVQNVALRLNGTGPNLVLNGSVESSTDDSSVGWVAQGNHAASFVTNGVLHLQSTGHGDNAANRAEVDVMSLQPGKNYELSFEARWVYGKPRLIAQSWDHSLGRAFLIEAPDALGSPGLPNSALKPNPQPEVEQLRHWPVVPKSTEAVRVSAKVTSADMLASVKAVHRLDDIDGTNLWMDSTMFDDGVNGGDLIAGDQVYSALLTQYQAVSNVVQFFVRATTLEGAEEELPREGADLPGLWVVDDQVNPTDLRRMRYVISAYDRDALDNQSANPRPKYAYKFPRLSNQAFNMTLIVNEEEVFYGGGMRQRGSAIGRPFNANLRRSRWQLPRDRKFRDHAKFVYDNDPQNIGKGKDRITRYWLYQLGYPNYESEVIWRSINAETAEVVEESEPIGNEFLNRIYPNGSEGDLFRVRYEYWFTDNWMRDNRDADWLYKSTYDPIRYHTEWNLRSRETAYDYNALINFMELLTFNSFSEEEVGGYIDPILTPMYAAVRGYTADIDSFTLTNGQNAYFYRRPTDGRFMFLYWDGDVAFLPDRANHDFIGTRFGLTQYFGKPYTQRVFKHYLTQLYERYTENSIRLDTWLSLEESMSVSYDPDRDAFEAWFTNRAPRTVEELGSNPSLNFHVSTGNGFFTSTTNDFLTLEGVAPSSILSVVIPEHPEATVVWTDETSWTVSDIVLKNGANQLTIQGVNGQGEVIDFSPFTAVKNGNAPPIVDVQGDPNSWRVDVNDTLRVDASKSYDPEGLPLSLVFSVSGAVVELVGNGDQADVYFPRPGLYSLLVTLTDDMGQMRSFNREISVYGYRGFSAFNADRLGSEWEESHVERRDNYSPESWYALEDRPGKLMLQVSDESEKPLAFSGDEFPWIHRPLPPEADWSLQTKVSADGRRTGKAQIGLMIELTENGHASRLAYGMQNGNEVRVNLVTSANTVVQLNSRAFTDAGIEIRIRRAGSTLYFEWLNENVWTVQYTKALPVNTAIQQGGIFTTTEDPIEKRSGFDYAMLVDMSPIPAGTEAVRINELLSYPHSPGVDRVELMNESTNQIDIGNWIISDDPDRLKYQIPQGTILNAGGHMTFDASVFTNPVFAFDSLGESVWLFAADASSNVLAEVDHRDFGAADLGVSFGYHLNSLGEPFFTAQSTQTFGGSNAAPRVGPVVISEIRYVGESNFASYVELQNITAQSVDLFETNAWSLSGVGFTFPPGTTLAPYEVILIAEVAPEVLRTQYGAIPAGVRIFGPWSGTLQTDGERLVLAKAPVRDVEIDAVRYSSETNWPGGPVIERSNLTGFGTEPQHWLSGGSPGETTFPPLEVAISDIVFEQFVTLQSTALPGYTPGVEVTLGDLTSPPVSWLPATILTNQLSGGFYQTTIEYPAPNWQRFYLRVVNESSN